MSCEMFNYQWKLRKQVTFTFFKRKCKWQLCEIEKCNVIFSLLGPRDFLSIFIRKDMYMYIIIVAYRYVVRDMFGRLSEKFVIYGK